MMAIFGERTASIEKFGGLNIEDDPSLVGDRELIECVNFLLGPAGNLYKRSGFSRIGSFVFPATPVRILGQFLTGTFNQVIASTPNEIYYSGDNGTTWALMNSTAGAVSMAQYRDFLYIVTLTGGVKKWTGSVFSSVASSPNGAQIVAFKDRLWVVGTGSTNYNRLYYSDPGASSETWGASGFIDIGAGDGDKLVAIAPYQDHFVCFKTRSIHNLYLAGDVSLWQRKLASSAHGATSPTGVIEVDGLLYFIYNKGIYRTDGVLFRELSAKIRSAFENTPLVPITFLDDDSISLLDRQLVCTFNSPVGVRTFVYNLDQNGWTELRISQTLSLTPGEIVNVVASNGVSRRLVSQRAASTGRVYEFASPSAGQVFKDDGNNYDSWIRTKQYDFGEFPRFKRGKLIILEASGIQARPSIGYFVDQNDLRTVINSSDVIVDAPAAYRIPGPGFFREVGIFIKESTDSPFNLLGFTVFLHSKRTVIEART